MALTKEHWIFIDNYIQTMDYAQAAKEMGVPQKEAVTAGLNLIANKEIQEAIKLRRSELVEAMKAIPLNKEQILATMMFQYQSANKQGRTKEAVDILSQIAQAQGIDMKTIQAEPINLIINNLDENKI
jgi:phage terminase small subunit